MVFKMMQTITVKYPKHYVEHLCFLYLVRWIWRYHHNRCPPFTDQIIWPLTDWGLHEFDWVDVWLIILPYLSFGWMPDTGSMKIAWTEVLYKTTPLSMISVNGYPEYLLRMSIICIHGLVNRKQRYIISISVEGNDFGERHPYNYRNGWGQKI